jgi:hypothetical protein
MLDWFWQFFFVFSRVEHVHEKKIHFSTRNTMDFFHDVTVQTRIAWSVKPANNVCPSADQAMETHSGCLASSRTSVYAGLSSSTMDLEKRSVTYQK